MERETYLRELAAAYQGEVRGEAGFTALAAGAADADEADRWRLLARLEAATRAKLEPLLRRHGLDTAPDPEQRRAGLQRAERRAAMGWSGAIRSMSESLPAFVERYAALEAAGPAEDKAVLAFLTAHEVALVDFCAAEMAGEPDSLAPVRELLEE